MTQQQQPGELFDHWRGYGFSFDHPLIEGIIPKAEELEYQTVLDSFIQTLNGNAAVLRFGFLDNRNKKLDHWELVLLPEQLATFESPAASALRGGRYRDDSTWVIRGWAQLHGDDGYLRVGTGTVVDNTAQIGYWMDQDYANPAFGQFVPDDDPRKPERSTRDIPWVRSVTELPR